MVTIDFELWKNWIKDLPEDAPEKVLVEILMEKCEDDKERFAETESDKNFNEFIYPH
ncbi:MAG: hypothetical protein KKF12_14425 [Proteobacteria bacterium]|nr:hypothetical protein [Pseudomonadota bacterium]MBU4132010.1 hypothetical protein [Pseudomonadota bacterium]